MFQNLDFEFGEYECILGNYPKEIYHSQNFLLRQDSLGNGVALYGIKSDFAVD